MENHDIVTCAWLGNTDDFTAVATLQLDLHKHKSQPGDDVNVKDEPSIQGLGLGNKYGHGQHLYTQRWKRAWRQKKVIRPAHIGITAQYTDSDKT